ncbi:MAG: hypothetical protein QGH15_22085, partial [Kiritimatiellia bacterium]|nr:hypothetical protein [Kiritimatiellia bacterium]
MTRGAGKGQSVAKVHGIEQVFTLDADGQFDRPRFSRLMFSDRRPAFREVLRRGEDLEFQTEDLEGARAVYRTALGEAESDVERVEVLNALGRLARRSGDLEGVEATHAKLKAYPLVFDADGAHPLSLSSLRLAQALSFDGAAGVIREWSEAVQRGQVPIYPGCRQVVGMFRERIGRKKARGDRIQDVQNLLDSVVDLVDLVNVYPRLHRAGPGRRTFLSGVDEGGKSYLVYLHPEEDGKATGVSLDLEGLREAL